MEWLIIGTLDKDPLRCGTEGWERISFGMTDDWISVRQKGGLGWLSLCVDTVGIAFSVMLYEGICMKSVSYKIRKRASYEV